MYTCLRAAGSAEDYEIEFANQSAPNAESEYRRGDLTSRL